MPSNESARIILLGNPNVGKSSFLRALKDGGFNSRHERTRTVDLKEETVVHPNNEKSKILICDLAGTYTPHVSDRYIDGATICILMIDLANRTSLDLGSKSDPNSWLGRLEQLAPGIPLILVANKSDLTDTQQITASELQEYAEKNKIAKTYTISLKNCPNRKKVAQDIIRDTVNTYLDPEERLKKERAKAILEDYIQTRQKDRFGATTGPYSLEEKTRAAEAVIDFITKINQCPPIGTLTVSAPAITQRGFLGFGRKRLGKAYQEAYEVLGGLLPSIDELEKLAAHSTLKIKYNH